MLLAAVLAPASHVRLTPPPSRGAKRPAFPRTGPILLEEPSTLSLYEQYLETRQAGAYPAKSYELEPRRPGAATAPAPAPTATATATMTDEAAPAAAEATAAEWLEWEETGVVPPMYAAPPPQLFMPASEAAPPRASGADWRAAAAAAPDAASAPDAGAGIDWSPGWSRPGGGTRHPAAAADPSPSPNLTLTLTPTLTLTLTLTRHSVAGTRDSESDYEGVPWREPHGQTVRRPPTLQRPPAAAAAACATTQLAQGDL